MGTIAVMAELKKIQVMLPERFHRALAIEASARGVDQADVVRELIEANLQDSLEIADRKLASEPLAKRRGRKSTESD